MPDKIKILMAGSLPIDLEAVKGGVEAVIVNLFSGFSMRDDIDVVHVSFTKDVHETKIVQYSTNVRIYFIPFTYKIDLLDFLLNTTTFRDILVKENPDLVHIQEITPHLIRFIRLPKPGVVVTQHGIMKEELKYATGIGQKLKCLFKMYVEKYIFPTFRNIIFISDYNKGLFPGEAVISKRIYNPVNPSFFKMTPARVENQHTLMYVGVLSRRKNVRLVVEALHKLKEKGIIFELHVVGGFKDKGYESEVMGLVAKYQLADQIIFHGWKKQQEIVELYRKCTYFILPSLQETLPVSIGEAMALGKIVIASDVGAIREMFRNNDTGYLFKRNDLEDLVAVLKTVYQIRSPEDISARVRNEAEEKYHPAHIAKETRDFYTQVIQSKTAQSS
jgi:glycosyltransferase involved in cell wall biosynthesis